jgi:hypothetical protein
MASRGFGFLRVGIALEDGTREAEIQRPLRESWERGVQLSRTVWAGVRILEGFLRVGIALEDGTRGAEIQRPLRASWKWSAQRPGRP